MNVFSFRGNCLNDVEHIKHAVNIVEEYTKETKLVVLFSATDHTRKALEKVTDNFFSGNKDEALKLFDNIKKQHFDTAKYLLILNFNACLEKMVDIFTEVEWLLHDKPVWSYRYYYDQIVCAGELLISRIISAYMEEKKIANTFIDIRDVIRTDNDFMHAHIDIDFTAQKINELVSTELMHKNLVITQGFIGSTDENESTTLGALGADYSGAVLAKTLNADKLIIWQEAEALRSNVFDKHNKKLLIRNLSYADACKIAMNADEFIHPKALQTLIHSNITTEAKYFYDTSVEGTMINNQQSENSAFATIVAKDNQALIICKIMEGETFTTKLTPILESITLQPNLIYQEDNLIRLVVDDVSDKIETFAQQAGKYADVHVEKGLKLISFLNSSLSEVDEYISPGNRILIANKDEIIQVLTK